MLTKNDDGRRIRHGGIAKEIFGKDWKTVTLLKTQIAIPLERRAFDKIISWTFLKSARRKPRCMFGNAGVNGSSPSTLLAGHFSIISE